MVFQYFDMLNYFWFSIDKINNNMIKCSRRKDKGDKVMLLNEFLQTSQTIKDGTWTKATWKSEKIINGSHCEKISKGVVRFVEYGHIKGVEVKHVSENTNYIVKNRLYVASNGNLLVRFAKTPIRAKSIYKINGVEVDKDTYETMVKKSNNNSPVFNVHLENLISLGK